MQRLVKEDQHALVFQRLTGPLVINAVGDSAFSAGEFAGLALQGGFILVAERDAQGKLGGKSQVLDLLSEAHLGLQIYVHSQIT